MALSALYTGSTRRALTCLCPRDPFTSDWSFRAETITALEDLERRYQVPSLAAGDAEVADRLEGFGDRVIVAYFLRFRRKPMPPSRMAPDARSVSVPGSGTRTPGVAWALPGSMKRTASAIRVINSR
jgi:hypothetical protein